MVGYRALRFHPDQVAGSGKENQAIGVDTGEAPEGRVGGNGSPGSTVTRKGKERGVTEVFGSILPIGGHGEEVDRAGVCHDWFLAVHLLGSKSVR